MFEKINVVMENRPFKGLIKLSKQASVNICWTCLSVFILINSCVINTVKADLSWPSESDYYYQPSSKATEPCLYHKCSTNPLTSCIFSSDLLTSDDCKQRELCQRLIIWETRRTGPLSEELVLNLYSFEIENDKPFQLQLNVVYEYDHHQLSKQTFKCQYLNRTVEAIMIDSYNNSEIYGGKGNHAGHYINCEWIISPSGLFYPLDKKGQKLNLVDHIFMQNTLIVNNRAVFVTTLRPIIQRLSYLTDILYPRLSYPFNPCQEVNQTCEGRLLIGQTSSSDNQYGKFWQIYLIVFDDIDSIKLTIKHHNTHPNGSHDFGELVCVRNNNTYSNDSLVDLDQETSELSSSFSNYSQSIIPYNCRGYSDETNIDSHASHHLSKTSQLNVSSISGNHGLRVAWSLMVTNLAEFFVSSQSGAYFDFIFEIKISTINGTNGGVRGQLKIPIEVSQENEYDIILLYSKAQKKCPFNGISFVLKPSIFLVYVSFLILFLFKNFPLT